MTATLEGLETVMKNLNREVVQIKSRSLKGLIRAAIIVRRSMDKNPPLVPVDTGNLRASWFVETIRNVDNPAVFIGFSANYATFVHENVGANFNRPGAGAKFFEASLKLNEDLMLEAIRQEAAVK